MFCAKFRCKSALLATSSLLTLVCLLLLLCGLNFMYKVVHWRWSSCLLNLEAVSLFSQKEQNGEEHKAPLSKFSKMSSFRKARRGQGARMLDALDPIPNLQESFLSVTQNSANLFVNGLHCISSCICSK